MAEKLRELESWYVADKSDQFTYNPAYVAAYGWGCPRTGIYLTSLEIKGRYRVRILPGLDVAFTASPTDEKIKQLKATGIDGVRFRDRQGSMMLVFDCRNVIKPAGPPNRRGKKSKSPTG